jgi:tetratricopeptide (TPR) repeat protein
LNAALETQVKIYGEEHPETAQTLLGLVSVQGAKGDYAGAEQILQKIIAIYHKQPPEEQTAMKVFSTALINFGDVKWTMGDYSAADSAYSEALSVASQLQNQDRESVADAKAGLGRARYAQGKLDEAVSVLQEAVNDYRSLPRLRVKLPDALNFLAQVLIWKKESQKALSFLQESEAISFEVWGENNGYYPRSLWLRTYALCFMEEYKEAEKTLDKAEAIYNSNFPGDKIIKGNLCDARNLVFTHTGREQQGETFGRQAVELYQSSTNRGSASITLGRLHLGENLIVRKKFDQAEQILLEAYKDASEVQGADHWRTKEVAREIIKLYKSWNKPDSASTYLSKAN